MSSHLDFGNCSPSASPYSPAAPSEAFAGCFSFSRLPCPLSGDQPGYRKEGTHTSKRVGVNSPLQLGQEAEAQSQESEIPGQQGDFIGKKRKKKRVVKYTSQQAAVL